MMTQEQIKVFEELLQEPNFKGKMQLRHLLWVNSSKPKFKEGDCFEIEEIGFGDFSKPPQNLKAKVVKVTALKDRAEWFYHLEADIEDKGQRQQSYIYRYESELERAERAEDNINILG